MNRRRGTTAFTIVVTSVTAIGALIMAVVLILSGAPTALVVGAVLAALPVGPLLWCFLWLDRYEPEPRHLLAMALGWGAFVATSGALILQLIDQGVFAPSELIAASVVAPVTEEAAKGAFLLLLFWFRRHELDGVLDGIVYAGMIGIGFAFSENILYLSSAYVGDEDLAGGFGSAVTVFVLRGIFSPFAHPFFTAFTGIGIGLAVTTRRSEIRILAPLVGFGLAVLSHGLWNGSLSGDARYALLAYVGLMVPAFSMMVGFAIWASKREGAMLTTALGDCAQRGFLPSAEVPWLVRIPARRAARRVAKQRGGGTALAVMKEYQAEAVELGFLHARYLRGTAPIGFAAAGQAHVDRMAQLRPYLLWPGSPGGLGNG
ncbi:MAG: PrsW family intramembrane metalloprotease [Marmoricola sp.]